MFAQRVKRKQKQNMIWNEVFYYQTAYKILQKSPLKSQSPSCPAKPIYGSLLQHIFADGLQKSQMWRCLNALLKVRKSTPFQQSKPCTFAEAQQNSPISCSLSFVLPLPLICLLVICRPHLNLFFSRSPWQHCENRNYACAPQRSTRAELSLYLARYLLIEPAESSCKAFSNRCGERSCKCTISALAFWHLYIRDAQCEKTWYAVTLFSNKTIWTL